MIDSIRTNIALALSGLFGKRYTYFMMMEEAGRMPTVESLEGDVIAFPARAVRAESDLRAAA